MRKILVLWGTFRSRSTAFECMMRQRGDFFVLHEPFGLSFYKSEDRKSDRLSEIEIQAEHNYQTVLQRLQQQAKLQPVFIKDMPYYVADMLDEAFLANFENTFIIRHPAQVLPSLYYKWPDFTLEETGYEQLYECFKIAKAITGKIPVVIDADDLVQKPEATIKTYCEAIGIPFIPKALEWEVKERPELWWYDDNGSWHNNLKSSSGFSETKNKNYLTVEDNEHLKRAYEFCLPYYQKLYEHRLSI